MFSRAGANNPSPKICVVDIDDFGEQSSVSARHALDTYLLHFTFKFSKESKH